MPRATRLLRIVPAAPGWLPDLHDVVDRQARLDRRLVPGRVDVQIPVEEEVAHDRDAQLRVSRR